MSMEEMTIVRKELLKAWLGNRPVTSVDVREITLAPGQAAGRHLHPCMVIGYIVSGTVLFQIEGLAAQILEAGAAFHEPAGEVIAHFDNASETEPMTFIACYLLDGEQQLIQML
jgi:quercetin dioxygenase-like cupin family protein